MECIDRNYLVKQLLQMEVDVTGIRPAKAYHFKQKVDEFIHTEVISLVLEQPYFTVPEKLIDHGCV